MKLFKPTISLSGGIGNQLFQWAAAHVLFRGTVFNLNLRHYQLNTERGFQLDVIQESCSHSVCHGNKLGRMPFPKIFEWAAAKGVPANLLEPLGFFQESSFSPNFRRRIQWKTKLGTPLYVGGLFQDSALVDEAWPLIENELTYSLTQAFENVKARLDFPTKYAAVHVRRGDYPISTRPSHAIGQLDDEFFLRNTSGFDLPIILLTENANEVIDLGRTLKAKFVISNIEANPFETLSILKNSEFSLGSNSSLSWWGAYLAAKSGKLSKLPEGWSQWENYETPKLKNPSIEFSPSSWTRI